MSYFSYFPNFTYEIDQRKFIVKDILRRSTFISEYKPYTDLYYDYVINDSETLQSIAESYYGSAKYYWVITIFNEIHDIDFELPMITNVLEAYIENKYGSDKYKRAYYIDIDTNLIAGQFAEYIDQNTAYTEPENPGDPENIKYIPMTFYDHEVSLNEERRKIKILRKELLFDFITQFRKSLING